MFKEVFLASILTGTGYAAYYFFTQSSFAQSHIHMNHGKAESNISKILFQRGVGLLCYGIIPFFIILTMGKRPISDYGLAFENLDKTFHWTIALAAGIIPFGIISGMRLSRQENYPQIRQSHWSISLAAVSAVSWSLYIFAYEFILRGLFFFSCWRIFGITAAVSINIAVYALFHIHKSTQEMIGSFFFGAVLCSSVYFNGNIWPALAAHITLALSTEWSAIHFNSKMKMNWNWRI